MHKKYSVLFSGAKQRLPKQFPCKSWPDKCINKHPVKEIRCLLPTLSHRLSLFPNIVSLRVFPSEPVTHPDGNKNTQTQRELERSKGMKWQASLPKASAGHAWRWCLEAAKKTTPIPLTPESLFFIHFIGDTDWSEWVCSDGIMARFTVVNARSVWVDIK